MIKVTGYAILCVIISVASYDVYAFMKGGTEATVSHVILVWSYNYPIFTFAFGVLVGHLFWRTRDTAQTESLGKQNNTIEDKNK